MSLSFNNLCIQDNAVFDTSQIPSPMDEYQNNLFPNFDKVNFLLEKQSPTSTQQNTSFLPTPKLSPALPNSQEEPVANQSQFRHKLKIKSKTILKDHQSYNKDPKRKVFALKLQQKILTQQKKRPLPFFRKLTDLNIQQQNQIIKNIYWDSLIALNPKEKVVFGKYNYLLLLNFIIQVC